MNKEQKEGLERSIKLFEEWVQIQISSYKEIIEKMKKQLE